ncbi:MAG TPA: hypothetical protein VLG71_01115, partial [Candidatus Limnocylindria bacterium]|nr:hypothetical protein [Candidatus Limnocylindria bacterium]
MKIILSTLIIAGFYSFLYPAATIATRQRTQSVSHRPTLTATVVTRQRSHSAPTTQSELERVRKWQATQTMQRSINSRSLDPSRSVV